jgi:hypothetical protein
VLLCNLEETSKSSTNVFLPCAWHLLDLLRLPAEDSPVRCGCTYFMGNRERFLEHHTEHYNQRSNVEAKARFRTAVILAS